MNTRRKILASVALLAALAAPVGAQQKATTTPQKATATAQQKPVATAQQKPTTKTATKVATKATSRRTTVRYPAVQQERPGLLARATVKPLAATRTALNEVPGARVVSRKLVERDQNLVYVITLKPRSGPEKEVNVDAKTGRVVPLTPSTPKGL